MSRRRVTNSTHSSTAAQEEVAALPSDTDSVRTDHSQFSDVRMERRGVVHANRVKLASSKSPLQPSRPQPAAMRPAVVDTESAMMTTEIVGNGVGGQDPRSASHSFGTHANRLPFNTSLDTPNIPPLAQGMAGADDMRLNSTTLTSLDTLRLWLLVQQQAVAAMRTTTTLNLESSGQNDAPSATPPLTLGRSDQDDLHLSSPMRLLEAHPTARESQEYLVQELMRFVRLHIAQTDMASIYHVLLGAAQLILAAANCQTIAALSQDTSSGGAMAAFERSGGNRSPNRPSSPKLGADVTQNPLSIKPEGVAGANASSTGGRAGGATPLPVEWSLPQHLSKAYVLSLQELRALGRRLLQIPEFLALHPVCHNFALDLIDESTSMAELCDTIPRVMACLRGGTSPSPLITVEAPESSSPVAALVSSKLSPQERGVAPPTSAGGAGGGSSSVPPVPLETRNSNSPSATMGGAADRVSPGGQLQDDDDDDVASAASLDPPRISELILLAYRKLKIRPSRFDIAFHCAMIAVFAAAWTSAILCIVFAHYLTLIPVGLVALLIQPVALSMHFWFAPVIFYLLQIVSCCLLSVGYTVDVSVYPDDEGVQRFPLSLIACAALTFFACALADQKTFRIRSAIFLSPTLRMLAAVQHLRSRRGTRARQQSSGEEASEIDDEEFDEATLIVPPWTGIDLMRVEPRILQVYFPLIVSLVLAAAFVVRLGLTQSFQQGGAIVGEVCVVLFFGACVLRYHAFAQLRMANDEEHFFLIVETLRLAFAPENAAGAETKLPLTRQNLVTHIHREGSASNSQALIPTAHSGSSRLQPQLLAMRQTSSSNNQMMGSLLVGAESTPVTAAANGNHPPLQQPSQLNQSANESLFASSAGGQPRNSRLSLSSALNSDSAGGSRNTGQHGFRSGGALQARGGQPDQEFESSIAMLMEQSQQHRGNPNNRLRSPPRDGRDSSMNSRSGGDGPSHVSSSLAIKSITLAGKNIATHGEMLMNVSTLNHPGAVGLWRTPLDEVHFSTILIGVDGRGDIVLWNWFAEDVTGFHASDMIGRNILSILPSPEFHAEMFSKISQTMADRICPTIRCGMICRRSGRTSVDVTLQPYPGKSTSGSTVGVLLAGLPVRHETLGEISNQLLDIHSSLPDGHSKDQLYKALLMLQNELPRSTGEVNLPHFLGRIFSAQFQRKAILLDIRENFPASITIDTESLQLVVMEMLQHYMRFGRIKVLLSVDEVARCAIVKVQVSSTASTASLGGAAAVDTLAASINPAAPMTMATNVPKWKPSVTSSQAARKINCVVRTENVVDAMCSLTLVGVIPAALHRAGKFGSGADGAADNDSVRCNVALYDPEALSSTVIRNVIWERKHLLYFIDDLDKLRVAIDGVDILFVRLPRGQVEKLVASLRSDRPMLEIVVMVSNDTSDRNLLRGKSVSASLLEDPILTNEVHEALIAKVSVIAERKQREDKVSDIRKIFTQSKSCPWVRGRLLGRGAHAMVYEATNTITSGKMAVRTLAIKPDEPEEFRAMMESLIEEIKVMSMLEHKNIINYLYLERDEHAINVFMEYAPGGSIRSLLDKKGKASLDQVALWLHDILEGLAYLHSEGIVHLDIKAANVLLAADGTCKLSDFGTARQLNAKGVVNKEVAADTSAGGETNASGTMHFMAPEVLAGTAFNWSADIWSLGCMTMEMITGKLPFSNMGPLAVIGYISSLKMNDVVTLPSEIRDPEAVNFLLACLTVDPSARPNAPTLQNHPFVARGRHLNITSAPPTPAAARQIRAAVDEDDDSDRRESCFSAWSAAGGDQFHERRRATNCDW